jgi:hypothetical protein
MRKSPLGVENNTSFENLLVMFAAVMPEVVPV